MRDKKGCVSALYLGCLRDFDSALASVGAQTIQNEQDAQQSVAKTGAAMLNI